MKNEAKEEGNGGEESYFCFRMTDSDVYAEGKDEHLIPSFKEKGIAPPEGQAHRQRPAGPEDKYSR